MERSLCAENLTYGETRDSDTPETTSVWQQTIAQASTRDAIMMWLPAAEERLLTMAALLEYVSQTLDQCSACSRSYAQRYPLVFETVNICAVDVGFVYHTKHGLT